MDEAAILSEYHDAQQVWPFIRTTEGHWHLPDCLLFAVGSRETDLRNVVGDGGHGHGVWQYDDRSHPIPFGFDSDVVEQCTTAALMIVGNIHAFGGNLVCALAAYNAGAGAVHQAITWGRDPDSVTTGGNYASDVLARLSVMHAEHIRELKASVRPAGHQS